MGKNQENTNKKQYAEWNCGKRNEKLFIFTWKSVQNRKPRPFWGVNIIENSDPNFVPSICLPWVAPGRLRCWCRYGNRQSSLWRQAGSEWLQGSKTKTGQSNRGEIQGCQIRRKTLERCMEWGKEKLLWAAPQLVQYEKSNHKEHFLRYCWLKLFYPPGSCHLTYSVGQWPLTTSGWHLRSARTPWQLSTHPALRKKGGLCQTA